MKTEDMAFHLPLALLDDDDDQTALGLLRTYYGQPVFGPGAATGALFDGWDSTGNRAKDTNRFTADDLVAVTFLSVNIPPTAARDFFTDRADQLTELLVALGPDRDLVDEVDPLTDDWAGWQLMRALRAPHKMGSTKASKLLARKRPRLRPIYDSVIAKATGSKDNLWEPLRLALRANDDALHHRLLRLRTAAGLPEQISALRVFDVIAWREGKDLGF
jgi:hypothetical protein